MMNKEHWLKNLRYVDLKYNNIDNLYILYLGWEIKLRKG